MILALPRETQLNIEAEVVGRGRITARRKERRIGLHIVVEAHRDQTREGVVGGERELERRVATRSRGSHRGDVARDGCLLAEREVEAQVQVAVHTTTSSLTAVVLTILTSLLLAVALLLGLQLFAAARTEEVKVVDLIAEPEHPVLTDGSLTWTEVIESES